MRTRLAHGPRAAVLLLAASGAAGGRALRAQTFTVRPGPVVLAGDSLRVALTGLPPGARVEVAGGRGRSAGRDVRCVDVGGRRRPGGPRVPYFRTSDTVLGMKTTLVIPDPIVAALKKRAADRGTTLSALATELLRCGLEEKPRAPYQASFPVFDARPALIDVANRDDTHDVLGAEDDARFYGWPVRPDPAAGPAPEPAER